MRLAIMPTLAPATIQDKFMEAQSSLPSEGRTQDPRVGQLVLLHVPGRPTPLEATVTAVTQNESRPPSLSLRIQVDGLGPTNLVMIEHISLGHPFGGWELRNLDPAQA